MGSTFTAQFESEILFIAGDTVGGRGSGELLDECGSSLVAGRAGFPVWRRQQTDSNTSGFGLWIFPAGGPGRRIWDVDFPGRRWYATFFH